MAKVLIIDDDADICEAIRLVLQSVGHEVDEAASGREGLAKVLEFRPDLIILDVMMEADTIGFHVAYQLRSEDPQSPYKEFRHVPILMLTAIGKQKGMAFSPETDQEFLPVDDFVEKPIQPHILLQKVEALLQRAKSRHA